MFELTSLDVHYLVKELSDFVGAKVEKIVQSDKYKKDVLLTMYLRDHPKIHLRFYLPNMICTPSEKPSVYPQVPPGFAMFLRKYLKGARIKSVKQPGFDRVVNIEFETKKETLMLVIELIPPGNMLLVDDGIIKNPLENQRFKDRLLLGKKPYVPPPQAFDPYSVSDDELIERITSSTKNSIVTTLAMHIGFGGVYAEEICKLAGVEKKRNDLKKEELDKVVKSIRDILEKEISPHTDKKRVYPFKLKSKEVEPLEGNFLSGLASCIEDEITEENTITKKPKDKLQTMLKAQTSHIIELEKRSAEERKKAERIFEEYQLVQQVLSVAQEARSKKEDINDALKQFPQVKKYVKSTGEIELEL